MLWDHREFARLAWSAGPGLCVLVVLCTVVAAAAPLGVTVAVGGVVGEVAGLARDGWASEAGRAAAGWTAAAGGVLLLTWASGALRSSAATALGDRIDARLQRDLMAAVLRPSGVAHLEDPQVADLVDVGRSTFRGGWGRPGRAAGSVSGLVGGRIVLVGACVLVAGFHPVLGAVLLAAGWWAVREERAASRREASHHYGDTADSRRTEYHFDLATTAGAAKEVRVFGMAGFLRERFSSAWHRSMEGVLVPLPVRTVAGPAVLGAVVLGGLAWIAAEAAAGRTEAGPAAVHAQALLVALGGVKQCAWTGLQTELAFATLRRFGAAVAAVEKADEDGTGQGGDAEGLPREEIRFQGVSFAYPGSARNVLTDVDLVIPAGTSLAVVGHNGAGKTTLVKLLCRLYEPTSGRIEADGRDLAGIDAAAWRRRLAAAFQDTVRFPLPAHVNVAFGRVDAAGDRVGAEAAARTADLTGAVERLPHGWDTVLSPEFEDGADLSGGQWQKLALARALFAVRHGAGVLVLDEPAAQLDARAEARLHERFWELTEGVTTLVISHRFSTVRRATSIVVLDGGRVAEQGSHDELLALDGLYARMFRLQAARFTDDADVQEVSPA